MAKGARALRPLAAQNTITEGLDPARCDRGFCPVPVSIGRKVTIVSCDLPYKFEDEGLKNAGRPKAIDGRRGFWAAAADLTPYRGLRFVHVGEPFHIKVLEDGGVQRAQTYVVR